MGWPGLPLLRATNEGTRGCSRDFLFYRLRRAGKQGLLRTFSVYPAVQSFAPSTGGRRSLPGAAWRRGRAVPGPLVTSPGRSGSSSGRFHSSKRLRPFQGTSRDVQHHGWTVRTRNAASGGSFWQSSSYIQVDIWQGSSWRGLYRACPLAHSGPSFSIGVSQ